MPPLIVPNSVLRKLWPSPERISKLLAENPGTIFGIISKTGASPKTRTLTRLFEQKHEKTGKITIGKTDIMIHDPLEETRPADQILARPIGLISLKKRFAFDSFVKRQIKPDDETRWSKIQSVEKERLEALESGRERRAERARQSGDASALS
ncbi:Nucleic acid-binding, OB-fold [Phaffia rhodozyma]|uniref:Nucleic acid-binding, OB-fold n=1 Tax=Phaffia rhodozyma TaxID=264483 RepID=A0A0F7SE92_PHARH|nr:Nucleic acid-binding, OB-fold [Phaffia rhodozyma]